MVERFSATIDEWVKKSKNRMQAIHNQSVQDVIDDAQLPIAKGGRMHVDTGFLRASGQASLNGMPTGPVRGDQNIPNYYSPDSQSVELTIGKHKIGQTFFFGWTANYARAREQKDAFLRLAAMKWTTFVARNVELAKQRFK